MAYSYSQAKALLLDASCALRCVNAEERIFLSYRHEGKEAQAIKELLKSRLRLFSKKLGGVVIAYNDVKLLSSMGTMINTQPGFHVGLRANFIIFQPTKACILKGVVHKKEADFIGCLVLGWFNASISRPRVSSDKVETETAWYGDDLEIGDTIYFRVVNTEVHNSIISIYGDFTENTITQSKSIAEGMESSQALSQASPQALQVKHGESTPLPVQSASKGNSDLLMSNISMVKPMTSECSDDDEPESDKHGQTDEEAVKLARKQRKKEKKRKKEEKRQRKEEKRERRAAKHSKKMEVSECVQRDLQNVCVVESESCTKNSENEKSKKHKSKKEKKEKNEHKMKHKEKKAAHQEVNNSVAVTERVHKSSGDTISRDNISRDNISRDTISRDNMSRGAASDLSVVEADIANLLSGITNKKVKKSKKPGKKRKRSEDSSLDASTTHKKHKKSRKV